MYVKYGGELLATSARRLAARLGLGLIRPKT
mgnify:CR=1 FL=1